MHRSVGRTAKNVCESTQTVMVPENIWADFSADIPLPFGRWQAGTSKLHASHQAKPTEEEVGQVN